MPTGALSEIIDIIRVRTESVISQALFAPTATGNNRLISTTIRPAWAEVIAAVSGTDREIRVPFNITFTSGVTRYPVPPYIGSIRELVRLNDAGQVTQYLNSFNDRSPGGFVWRLEHHTLVLSFDPINFDSQVWTLRYIPGADFQMHEGLTIPDTSTTFLLSAAPTLGTLDTRPNAYLGALLRVLNDANGILQERVVTAYDAATRICTVEAFDPVLSGDVSYDILPPLYTESLKNAVALTAARMMWTPSGAETKFRRLGLEAAQALETASKELHQLNGVQMFKFGEGSYDGPVYWNNSGFPGH